MKLRTIGLISTLVLGLLAGPLPAEAQQTGKVYRIGLLAHFQSSRYSAHFEAFREELRAHGYVEGRNIRYEYRYAGGKKDRLSSLAAKLVRLNVDVIVTTSTPSTRAAMKASPTIPIVMNSANSVETGLVASMARPGGNVTGMTVTSGPEFYGKRLELLKEVVPSASRVAVLWYLANASMRVSLKAIQAAAPGLGVTVLPVGVGGPDDFDRASDVIRKERPDALLAFPLFGISRRRIVELALKNRLPAIFTSARYVDAGDLIVYSVNFLELSRRKAIFVDKILKGARPADLPVEVPRKFELVINLKTAKALGITIPPSILYRADKVIK